MARYQSTEKGRGLFLPLSLADQLVPGTFVHTLAQLFDETIILRLFDKRYSNDQTAATAIEPAHTAQNNAVLLLMRGHQFPHNSGDVPQPTCWQRPWPKPLHPITPPYQTLCQVWERKENRYSAK